MPPCSRRADLGRHGDGEHGPAVGVILSPHTAALRRQKASGDRQAHARAKPLLPRNRPAIKALEHLFEIICRDASPAIADGDSDFVGCARHVHRNGRARP